MADLETYRRAVAKAEEACSRAAQGDLEARIIDIEECEELAGFLRAINRMLDLTDAYVRESGASLEYASRQKYFRPFLLRGMRGDFRRGAEIINSARATMKQRHELTEAFQADVAAVAGVVARAAGELQDTASGMTTDASTTFEQSVEASAASEDTARNAQAVAASAEELSASISEIGRQVAKSTEATRTVIEEMESANASVKGLLDSAQQVDRVVGFIQEVASQTNLLALNATIEAARAGDAGRGFAVVASEVKGLARQVADATKDITDQLANLQKASDRTASAIAGINERAVSLDEVATVIASAVEEQSAATAEISTNVQQAAQGSQNVSHNIGEIKSASEKTGSSAQAVLDSAQGLASEVETLDRKFREFLDRIRAA
ncbi:MAG: methyl-accepting chemotaxis protein [Alphaproteobacteria bacterium]|jgi:methyl-accepting chemotaxis protein